jgi:hypothetical protein
MVIAAFFIWGQSGDSIQELFSKGSVITFDDGGFLMYHQNARTHYLSLARSIKK